MELEMNYNIIHYLISKRYLSKEVKQTRSEELGDHLSLLPSAGRAPKVEHISAIQLKTHSRRSRSLGRDLLILNWEERGHNCSVTAESSDS